MRDMTSFWVSFALAVSLSSAGACSSTETEPDAGPDVGVDAETDANADLPDADSPDAGPAPIDLTLCDVSILYPLPEEGSDQNDLLGASDEGERGVLLPEDVVEAIPMFPFMTEDTINYDPLRVVGVRFDGCHDDGDGCEAQIRMVMQPLSIRSEARDSALHLFYSLEDEEFRTAVAELRGLRAFAGETDLTGPLRVHPVLSEQGLAGEYASELKTLLLRYAGEENLTRMTFFLRAPPVQEVWFFGGFDREGGTLSEMDIVGLDGGNQRVIRTEVTDGYDYLLTPEALEPEDGSTLFTSAAANAASPTARDEAFASFLRVQNPTIHKVADLPCAGCHIATFVTEAARTAFDLDDGMFPEDAYQAPQHDLSLTGEAATTPSSLRAFGWFERLPVIAQRTVNETSAVLIDLAERFPPEAAE